MSEAGAGIELPRGSVFRQSLLAAHRARRDSPLRELVEDVVPTLGVVALAHRYWPVKCGGRFCTNAVNASRRSSVWTLTLCARPSTSSACASDIVGALLSSRFVIESAIGGPPAMASAIS